MKIGEFAKKHGVTHDTIRYYIDKGLIVPNKKDGQYRFNEVDSMDIERIIELKQMHFSLSDIHRIMTFQTIGGSSTEFSRNLFLLTLEEKQKHIKEELSKYNRLNEYLIKKIDEVKTQNLKHDQLLGFPLTSTHLLACPRCMKILILMAGVIENNMIIDADIECECGYTGKIKDGIYIDEKAIRPKLLHGKPIPSKEEYVNNTSHNYINYLYKGMAKLIEYIREYQKEPEYIMELNNCVGFFLLQYINYLPKDATYILIDYDLQRMTQLKNNLERYYSHKKFIFLCCEYNSLPIKKLSLDLVVDFLMSSNYENANDEDLIQIIVPYLKENGIITGSYRYSMNGNLDARKRMGDLQLNTMEQMEIRPAYKEDTQHSNEKEVEEHQFVYAAKKMKNMV